MIVMKTKTQRREIQEKVKRAIILEKNLIQRKLTIAQATRRHERILARNDIRGLARRVL